MKAQREIGAVDNLTSYIPHLPELCIVQYTPENIFWLQALHIRATS
jgi:hypothetical protein